MLFRSARKHLRLHLHTLPCNHRHLRSLDRTRTVRPPRRWQPAKSRVTSHGLPNLSASSDNSSLPDRGGAHHRATRSGAASVLFSSLFFLWRANRVEPLLAVLEETPSLAVLVKRLTASGLERYTWIERESVKATAAYERYSRLHADEDEDEREQGYMEDAADE